MKCKCGIEHEGEGLPPSKKGKLSTCAKCYKKQKRLKDQEWRSNNKDLLNKYSKNWRIKNPKKVAEAYKNWRQNYKAKRRKRKEEYEKTHAR